MGPYTSSKIDIELFKVHSGIFPVVPKEEKPPAWALLLDKKFTRSDAWLDPFCCREGQDYLQTRSTALKAWDECFRPDFLCWFLDVMRTKEPFLDIPWGAKGAHFTRTPWRLVLYRDFLRYEMEIPAWFVWTMIFQVKKSRFWARLMFWIVTGYFDSVRGQKNPTSWWVYTAQELKETYKGVRFGLSEEN